MLSLNSTSHNGRLQDTIAQTRKAANPPQGLSRWVVALATLLVLGQPLLFAPALAQPYQRSRRQTSARRTATHTRTRRPQPAATRATPRPPRAGQATGRDPQTGLTRGLQLTLEAYSDDGTLTTARNIGNLVSEETTSEVGRGVALAVGLNYLVPVLDVLRLGPGIRYLSSYRYELDGDDADDGDPVLLGKLFELYVRAEFTIRLPGRFSLAPGLELGIPLLLPAGTLQEDLNNFERQGYDVNDLPRIGVLAGADMSVGYALRRWLVLSAGLGLQYDRILLYDGSVDGGNGEVSSDLVALRVRFITKVEAQF